MATEQANLFYPGGTAIYLNLGDRAFENERGKTESVTIGVPKNIPYDVVEAIGKRCSAIAQTHIGGAAFVDTPSGKKMGFNRSCLKDGDELTDSRCHGYWIIKANSKFPIKIYGADNNELTPAQVASQLWPGQNIFLKIELKWYEGKESKGVTAYLKAIRVAGGGTRVEGATGGETGEDLAKATSDVIPAHFAQNPAPSGGGAGETKPIAEGDEEIPW